MKITKILVPVLLTFILAANAVFADVKTETILKDIVLPAPVKTGFFIIIGSFS